LSTIHLSFYQARVLSLFSVTLWIHILKLITMETDAGFIAALEEAKKGAAEGGVPIGAALVSKDGKILGRGHNMRVQKGSATLHVSPN
jgi:hypothetical protein